MEINLKGALKITGFFFADPKGTPSEALRQFHKQLMLKAHEAISIQPIERRDYSSTIIAINDDDLPLAKLELKNFREKFDKKLSSNNKKTKVYCLGMQFFCLQDNTSI